MSFGLSRERADKESFYEGQGKTAGGFMHMALTTLALLNKLSAHPMIKQSFLQPPLVGSAAYNCLHFLELLVRLHAHMLQATDISGVKIDRHMCCMKQAWSCSMCCNGHPAYVVQTTED